MWKGKASTYSSSSWRSVFSPRFWRWLLGKGMATTAWAIMHPRPTLRVWTAINTPALDSFPPLVSPDEGSE